MAVDQSVLLLKSGNDFDKSQIVNGLENWKTETPKKYHNSMYKYPGSESGLVTMTNANFAYRHRIQRRFRIGQTYPCRFFSPCSFGLFNDDYNDYYYQRFGVVSYLKSPRFFETSSYQEYTLPETVKIAARPQPRIRKQFPETWFFDDIEK